MTHEIEVRVKVEGVAGEIVFYVSDMPRVESSVRKNLANFDNWLYAKWTKGGVFHCIEAAAQGQALALAQDTIRIALKTIGYKNVDTMTQFERASALLNVAQEYMANCESLAHYEFVFDNLAGEITNVRKRGITS